MAVLQHSTDANYAKRGRFDAMCGIIAKFTQRMHTRTYGISYGLLISVLLGKQDRPTSPRTADSDGGQGSGAIVSGSFANDRCAQELNTFAPRTARATFIGRVP